MKTLRGFRLVIALLLVTSAFVSISSFIPLPNVQGVPTLVITPGAAPPGFGTMSSGVVVSGSGWAASAALCYYGDWVYFRSDPDRLL